MKLTCTNCPEYDNILGHLALVLQSLQICCSEAVLPSLHVGLLFRKGRFVAASLDFLRGQGLLT